MISLEINSNQQLNFCQIRVTDVSSDSNNVMMFKIKANEEFPAKWVNLLDNNKIKKLPYLEYFIIELSQDLQIECEDWYADENLTKETAFANSAGLRWNDLDAQIEYNFMHKMPQGLYPTFYKYINLEHADIENIKCTSNIFELVLNASLSSTIDDEIGFKFHSGPFRFKGKTMKLTLF
jgi:hypothetical protein